MNEKVKDFFKNNIGYFIVGLVCVIYIATALITVTETGKTISQIIADGAIVLFLGLFINRIFDLQGMMNGDRDERVQNTVRLHGETVVRISPYIDRLDDWCEIKNKEVLKIQRTKILAGAGMKYDDFFDKDGVAKTFTPDSEKLKNKLTRGDELHRIKCYRKALRLKLTPLTASALTSEGGRKQDPYYLGRTKAQYETRAGVKDLIAKIGLACIFGYYGVELVRDFSYAALIWTSLQVGIFLAMGVIKMYLSYMFVIDEWRGRVIKKIDNLQAFENYIKASGNKPQETNTESEQKPAQSDEEKPSENQTEVKENGSK